MGAGASVPDVVDLETAKSLAGDDFDQAAFDVIATDGKVAKSLFLRTAAIAMCQKQMLKGADADFSQCCTDDCTFVVPGGPPLPMAVLAGMAAGMLQAFPWTNATRFLPGQEGDSIKAMTRQHLGVMKADIPAMGPFPEVKMADVDPEKAAKPIILPWETGIYTFEGDRIKSAAYSPDDAPQDLDKDATTMDINPPVGFPCIYGFLGVDLPPPPLAAAAGNKVTFAYFPIVGRGLQVHILAAEHGVELDVKIAKPFGEDFDKDTEAMFGTVPWMKDGELELNDSMAMVQYLISKYPGPATPATPEKAALAGNIWGWCQDYYGFVASPLHDIILGHSEPHWRNARLTDTLAEGGGGDDGKKAAVGKLKTLHDRRIGYLEAMLAKMGSPQFVTGNDYSYADIFLFTIVRAAQKCKGMQVLRDACGGDPFAACPTILAICDRVAEREAVKKACGEIFEKAPV